MATIFIDGTNGSDSPAGATNALKLATAQTPSGALKTLARLAALCNGYNTDTGLKYLDGGGTPYDVVVSGRMAGTPASPDLGWALFNCAVTGTPKSIRQWDASDGTPIGGTPEQFWIDPVVRLTSTFTYGASVWTTTLPATLTSSNVNRVLAFLDGAEDGDGSPRCVLKLASSAANAAATDNSYYIDPATRVLTMRLTDVGGTLITNATAQTVDSNDVNIGVTVTAAASTSAGTSSNAGLCLQTPAPVTGRCTIGPFSADWPGFSTSGTYPVSIEGGVDTDIVDWTVRTGGHHPIGMTGTASMTRCRALRGSAGRALCGSASGGYNCISAFGSGLTLCSVEQCTYRPGPVLSPIGIAATDHASLPFGYFGGGGPSVANPFDSLDVKDCRFIPQKTSGASRENGGITLAYTNPITAGSEDVASAYPLRFTRCEMGPSTVFTFGGGGTNDYANASMKDGVLNLRGGGAHTDNSYSWGVLRTNFTNNIGSVANPINRTLLFSNMLILLETADPRAFTQAVLSYFTTGLEGAAFRFKNCVLLNFTRQTRGQSTWWFDYTNSAGNCGLFASGSVFVNLYTKNLSNSRRLFRSDSGLSNRSTRQRFSGNHYVGFTHFSEDTSLDTQAEWLASGDTTGTFADVADIQSRTMQTRIRTALGATWGGGLDPMIAIRQAMAGNPNTMLLPAVGAGSFGSGLASGLVLAQE